MAGRLKLGSNVFDMAVKRMLEQYEGGHRIVVSLSGGKDSGVCLEICIIAATLTGRLPVEACYRDEEIAYPGTIEYLLRQAERPEVDLTWVVAGQPIPNAFDRESPYWWVFDPLVSPDDWVRKPRTSQSRSSSSTSRPVWSTRACSRQGPVRSCATSSGCGCRSRRAG